MAELRGKSLLLLFMAMVALAAAGVLWSRRGTADHSAERRTWDAVLQCAACGHRFGAQMKLTFPMAAQSCPKCGKQSAWELKRCSRCDHAFLPELSGDPPRPPMMPKCPRCGSDRHVGAVVPGSAASR